MKGPEVHSKAPKREKEKGLVERGIISSLLTSDLKTDRL